MCDLIMIKNDKNIIIDHIIFKYIVMIMMKRCYFLYIKNKKLKCDE